MLAVRKNIHGKKTEVSFDVAFCKKAQFATVNVAFPNCTDSALLQKLLSNFTHSKTMTGALKRGVNVIESVAGANSIQLTCMDTKVLSAVLALYMHVHKMQVTSHDMRFVNTREDNGLTFIKKLGKIRIMIIGKCKGTYAAINDESKKLNAFMATLDAIHDKFTVKAKVLKDIAQPQRFPERSFALNNPPQNFDKLVFYLAILLNGCPCTVHKIPSGFSLRFLSEHRTSAVEIKFDCMQRIKGWFEQYAVIKPRPTGEAGTKWDAKIEPLIPVMNLQAAMLSDLKGGKRIDIKTAEDCSVDDSIIKAIKTMKEM